MCAEQLALSTQAVHVLFDDNYEDWGMRNALRMGQLLDVMRDGRTEELTLDLGSPGSPPAVRMSIILTLHVRSPLGKDE